MFIFNADRTSEHDGDGNLVASIVTWTQECEEGSDLLTMLLFGCCGGFFVAIFLASFEPAEQLLLQQGAAVLFVGAVLIVLVGPWLCTNHRELHFMDDGGIAMPLGQCGWFRGKTVAGDHRDIMTIQQQPVEHQEKEKAKKYEVWIYFTDGYAVCIAEHIYQLQAHRVTALLTLARADMRRGMARLPQAAHPGQQNWGYATVD